MRPEALLSKQTRAPHRRHRRLVLSRHHQRRCRRSRRRDKHLEANGEFLTREREATEGVSTESRSEKG